MREYKYDAPRSWEELFEIARKSKGGDEVKFMAGGTDLMPQINIERNTVPTDPKNPMHIVYLGYLGLDSISEENGTVSIGACSILNDIMHNHIIREKLPVLAETIQEMAGYTIRNTGTIGGNIMNASPAGDSIPTMMAMDAAFVLKSEKGERTVKAAEFFTGPGRTIARLGEEVLIAIKIKYGKGKASFKKLGRRNAETLSIVNAAAYVEQEGGVCKTIRVASGSVGPVVVRYKILEDALTGKTLTEETIKAASQNAVKEISPIDDIRSSAWYRNRVTPVIVSRAIKAACGLE